MRWMRCGVLTVGIVSLLSLSAPWPVAAALNAWSQVSPSPAGRLRALAVDPSDANIVYVATYYGSSPEGLYRSTDGGRTWARTNAPQTAYWDLALDPLHPATIFAAGEGGLWHSVDSGATWMLANAADGLATSVAVDPVDPRNVYVATAFGSLDKSTDGGRTWRRLSSPELGLHGISPGCIAIARSNPNVIYVGTLRQGVGGVLKSTDAGETWIRLGTSPCVVVALAVSPVNADFVLAGSVALSGCGSVRVSDDGGINWLAPIGTYQRSGAHGYAFDVRTPSIIYAVVDGGVLRSLDGGRSFAFLCGASSVVPYEMAACPADPTRMYLLTQYDGLWSYRIDESPVFVSAPSMLTTDPPPGASTAEVTIPVEVRGAVICSDRLVVRDITSDRLLLDGEADLANFLVGPSPFPTGVSIVSSEVRRGTDVLARTETEVRIGDVAPPVLHDCGDRTIECTAPATAITPEALGVFAEDAVDPSPVVRLAPDLLPLGRTRVTAVASDASGNSSECALDVIVVDTRPPHFNVVPTDMRRPCTDPSGAVIVFDVLASDPSGVVSIECRDETGRVVLPSGALFEDGLHIVTCTASDSSGNEAQVWFSVEVYDDQDPLLECPDDVVTSTLPDVTVGRAEFEVWATDICDPDVEVTCLAPWGPVESGDLFPLGVTLVTCEAVDDAGNVGTCEFRIRVEDRVPPSISAPAEVTLLTDCAGHDLPLTLSMLGASVSDACDPAPTVVIAPLSVPVGTTDVVITAADADGNQAIKTVRVSVLRGPLDVEVLRPLQGGVENPVEIGRTMPVRLRSRCAGTALCDVTGRVLRIELLTSAGVVEATWAPTSTSATSLLPGEMTLQGCVLQYELSTVNWPTARGSRFRIVYEVLRWGHAAAVGSVVVWQR